MIKKDNEKSLKQMSEKSFFGLIFNRMESYHPEHLLVYYKFIFLAYVVNFRYTVRPPVLLQIIFVDR